MTSFRWAGGVWPALICLGMLLILCSFAPLALYGSERPLIEGALQGQTRLLERNYVAAAQTFQQLIREYPNHPTGFFGMMALWETKMLENDDFRFEAEYQKVAEEGLKVMDRLPSRKKTLSLWDRFTLSSGYGLHGFHYARKRAWWRAYVFGNKARHFLKTLVWTNPDYYDAYLGLGLYDYYRSAFTNQLWFLPFFPDKRAKGMEEVRVALEKGTMSHDLAQANLGLLYLHEKKFAEAVSLLQPMTVTYPNNIILRIYLVRGFVGQKEYAQAKEHLEMVLKVDSKNGNAVAWLQALKKRCLEFGICNLFGI